MTATELAEEVYNCLPPELQKRINPREVLVIVKLVFETIIEALMLGDSVRIRNFGRIEATFIKGGNLVWCEPVKRFVPRKPNIKLKLVPAKRLRKMVSKARTRMRTLAKKRKNDMEKYGYEQEKKDPKVKEAAEKGKCPKCGGALSGNPPVCSQCGSKPFEKQP